MKRQNRRDPQPVPFPVIIQKRREKHEKNRKVECTTTQKHERQRINEMIEESSIDSTLWV